MTHQTSGKLSRTIGCLAALMFLFTACHGAQASKSPVSFSIGDYAGDFVKEKGTDRIWYIDIQTSRRYQITDRDWDLYARLFAVSQAQPWASIASVPESNIVTVSYIRKTSLRGLVKDENAPDVLWHVQRRANRRQALRSREDILNYVQNATVVDPKLLAEYPLAYADFDTAVADPAKKPDLTASSTRPDLAKFIRISLKEQRLRAYENGKLVNTFLISTGRGKYPTPKGDFSVLAKLPVVNYVWSYGKDHPDNYDLGNVPFNLRIMPHKYIHYAYWHNNFGHTMSHGCVNVNLKNIKWIYRWADEGVPVLIQ